jgi:predicted ATP-dependent Lon-type protease
MIQSDWVGYYTIYENHSISAYQILLKSVTEQVIFGVSVTIATAKSGDHDYHLHLVEQHNTGPTTTMTLTAYVALCSGPMGKPVQPQLVVLGSMSLGGSCIT